VDGCVLPVSSPTVESFSNTGTGIHGNGSMSPQRLKSGEYSEEWYRLEIIKAYKSVGCTVVNFSQSRRTHQTPGIPDLKVYHCKTGKTWWHEVKRPGGRQSVHQRAFQAMCEACGEAYYLGELDAAKEALIEQGIALEKKQA